jgi:hypothetical protein
MDRSTGGERSSALAHDSGLNSTAQQGTTLSSRSTAFHFAMALYVFETDDAAALASPTEPRLAMTAADLLMADGLNGRSLASCVLVVGRPGKNKPLPHLFRLEHGKMFRVFFSPCQACLIILSRRRVTFSQEAGALDVLPPKSLGGSELTRPILRHTSPMECQGRLSLPERPPNRMPMCWFLARRCSVPFDDSAPI